MRDTGADGPGADGPGVHDVGGHGVDGHGVDGHGVDGHGVDGHAEDGYRGPAQLLADGGDPIEVDVVLGGHFDPISGHYAWYGRVGASADVAALLAARPRTVVLRTPHAEVETRLSDVDPWGRPRVEGFGATPFPVQDTLAG